MATGPSSLHKLAPSEMRVATICVAGALTAWLVGTGGVADAPWATAIFGVVVAFAWCFAGLAALRRRPENRTGRLMVLVGLAWLGSLLAFTSVSVLYTIGLFLGTLYFAVLVHLLLAFPGGRLTARLDRIVVAAAYVDTTLIFGLSVVFGDPNDPGVENLALVHRDQGLADVFNGLSATVGVLLFFVSFGILAARWRGATAATRRVIGPVLFAGAAAVAVLGVVVALSGAGVNGVATQALGLLMFAAVPFAFLVGLWRSRYARGAVADLVVELGAMSEPRSLRGGLARALGDPSLEIAYWLPERSRYVDVDGHPIDVPDGDGERVATVIEHGGSRVAALVHDASLRERPELVDAVRAAAGLALENERLQAELSARLVELDESRARIVEVGDAARRRIERDLHDGAQARLVSVAMTLGLADSKFTADPAVSQQMLSDARAGLKVAMRELRELSHGIHPVVLTERGLGAALQELVYTAPLPVDLAVRLDDRLPQPVETAAYFVVAEAVANVAKYAAATHVAITVDRVDGRAVVDVHDDGVGGADVARGTGLRGLADRLDAVGGTLAVHSPPGEGTRLTAEIPVRDQS
jgi:signal transduction histidine kinase